MFSLHKVYEREETRNNHFIQFCRVLKKGMPVEDLEAFNFWTVD